MFLMFEIILKNLKNHLNLKNLMFHLFLMYLKSETLLKNPLNRLNLKNLRYH
jgi:hypothetical protein